MSRGQRTGDLLELDADGARVRALREEDSCLLDEAARGREREEGSPYGAIDQQRVGDLEDVTTAPQAGKAADEQITGLFRAPSPRDHRSEGDVRRSRAGLIREAL